MTEIIYQVIEILNEVWIRRNTLRWHKYLGNMFVIIVALIGLLKGGDTSEIMIVKILVGENVTY